MFPSNVRRPEVDGYLGFGLGLGEVHHTAAVFPLTALFEEINALETLQDVAFGCDGAG
jgi:hypothetical protein